MPVLHTSVADLRALAVQADRHLGSSLDEGYRLFEVFDTDGEPLALIGGILAIYLTETRDVVGNTLALFGGGGRYQAPVISIASLVGFITLMLA